MRAARVAQLQAFPLCSELLPARVPDVSHAAAAQSAHPHLATPTLPRAVPHLLATVLHMGGLRTQTIVTNE